MGKIEELIHLTRRVKNTRLVLWFKETPEENLLKFLRAKHRHREIAVIGGKLRGSCFRKFTPPVQLDLPDEIPEVKTAISTSLLLLSPLLLLHEEKALEKYAVWTRHGNWKEPAELLRHIRIAEYAMIDGVDAGLTPESAARDGEKRFWRLKEETGPPLVKYLLVKNFLVVVLYVSSEIFT